MEVDPKLDDHKRSVDEISDYPDEYGKVTGHSEPVNDNCMAVFLALIAKGAQDLYMNGEPKLFDARLQHLTGIHQFSYTRVRL